MILQKKSFENRERVASHPDPEQAKQEFIARQKMGRLGTPDEIAHLITYLASDEVCLSNYFS